MKNGFGFIQATMILNRAALYSIVEEIKNRLQQGEKTECFIADYFPYSIRNLFLFHLRFLSFEKSLTMSLDNYHFSKSMKEKFTKSLFYPLLLFLLSWMGMAGFAIFFIPVLSSSLSGLGGEVNWMNSMRSCILFLFNGSLLIFLIIILLIFYFRNKRKQVYGFMLLNKVHKNNILKEMVSYQFIHYLCLCLDNGCSSLEAISLIRQQQFYPLLSFVSYHLHQDFEAGKEISDIINNAYLDESLSYFFQVALHSKEVTQTLQSYCYFKEEKWNQYLKKTTIILQLISYGMISIIVVSIYQVLLAPLQILSNL